MTPKNILSTLPLIALRSFESVSRLGSFKAAAAELSVTPAAVSHQIKKLETSLNTQLFKRYNRKIELTKTGHRLAKPLQQSFASINAILSTLSVEGTISRRSSLSISSAPTFASHWLMPLLQNFETQYENISVRILADNKVTNLNNDQSIDIAIRYGPGPYSKNLNAKKLWKKTMLVAVCSPEYASQHTMNKPRDLLNLELIHTSKPRTKGPSGGSYWESWLVNVGIDPFIAAKTAAQGPVLSHSSLAIEAAIASRGIALVPDLLIQKTLERKLLVNIGFVQIVDSNYFWILNKKNREGELKIRLFMDWITKAVAMKT